MNAASWIFEKTPQGAAAKAIPSMAEELGARRLAAAAKVVGMPSAKKAAREAGLYLLDDKLSLRLKLQGAAPGPGGEVAVLSPARWQETSSPEITEDCLGVVLEAGDRKRLLAFLRQGRAPASAPELASFARHFFFTESIKILIARNSPGKPTAEADPSP